MEITHAEYVINREQDEKKEHLVAGGSVTEWSKALFLGAGHSMAWIRIPPGHLLATTQTKFTNHEQE